MNKPEQLYFDFAKKDPYIEVEQKLFAEGYRVICHICQPAVGFKTIEEHQQHVNSIHRQWRH